MSVRSACQNNRIMDSNSSVRQEIRLQGTSVFSKYCISQVKLTTRSYQLITLNAH